MSARGFDGRHLQIRRRRRELAAHQRRSEVDGAPLVLQRHHGGSRRHEHRVRDEPLDVEVERRRPHVQQPSRAPRRHARALGRPQEPAPHDQRQRRWCDDQLRRRRDLVVDHESADGAILSRRDRRPVALSHLRSAAGQHDSVDAEPLRQRRHHAIGLVRCRRRRVGVHCAQARRPEHDHRRRVHRHDDALRRADQAGEGRVCLAQQLRRLGCARRAESLPVDVPDHLLVARFARALRHGATASSGRRTTATAGTRSAATSRCTIQRRSSPPADRSLTT